MKHLKAIPFFLILALLLSACKTSAPAAPAPTTAPAAADSATPTSALATPAPTAAPAIATSAPQVQAPAGKLVSGNGIEFTIPTGLGSGATASLIPEVQSPDGADSPAANPAYIEFKLQGYQTGGPKPFFDARLRVYAAGAEKIRRNVASLQATLAAPGAPLQKDSVAGSFDNGGLVFSSNMQRLAFANGKGLRMLGTYSQAIMPIDGSDLLYEYQGLTEDGKYFLIIDLPVNPSGLDGLTMPQDGTGYEAYLLQVEKILTDDEKTGKLSPALNLLDALAQSVKVDSSAVMLPVPLPTLPAEATLPAQATSAAPAADCNAAQFIMDVGTPDNTVFAPGAAFKKTWRLKNIGTCTWDASYSLVLDSGPSMAQDSSYPLSLASPDKTSVAPGESVDVSIDMKAGNTPGTYKTYWMLTNGKGLVVPMAGGHANRSFYVLIQVQDASASTGVITKANVIIEQQQGSGAICAAKTTYFVYLDITTNGSVTANYRVDATDDSGQVADGMFTDSQSPESSGSLVITAPGTQRIGLQLQGPYSYPDKVTIRVYLNGANLPSVQVACK